MIAFLLLTSPSLDIVEGRFNWLPRNSRGKPSFPTRDLSKFNHSSLFEIETNSTDMLLTIQKWKRCLLFLGLGVFSFEMFPKAR